MSHAEVSSWQRSRVTADWQGKSCSASPSCVLPTPHVTHMMQTIQQEQKGCMNDQLCSDWPNSGTEYILTMPFLTIWTHTMHFWPLLLLHGSIATWSIYIYSWSCFLSAQQDVLRQSVDNTELWSASEPSPDPVVRLRNGDYLVFCNIISSWGFHVVGTMTPASQLFCGLSGN